MVNFSLGEIDALSRKATRGAGYSWGIAEETGKAVRWLSAYGLLGAETLAKHLKLVSGNPSKNIPELIIDNEVRKFHYRSHNYSEKKASCCSLYSGALINDLGHHIENGEALKFESMLFPLLALPHVGRISEAYNMSVSFSFADTIIICNPTGIQYNGTDSIVIENSNVVCNQVESNNEANTHQPKPKSRVIEKNALRILEEFAHKTYAPATEESRLLGAGAGVTDND